MVRIYGGGVAPPSPSVAAKRWHYLHLGQNIYWLYPDYAITQTGAAVTTVLDFDFPFKLLSILVEHVDNVGALSTDAFTWSFNIAPKTGIYQNFPIVAYTASAASQFYEIFGDDYIFPAGTFRFITNTTNTDLVFVNFVLQRRSIT